MLNTPRRVLIAVGLGAYLIGLGSLVGVAIDRMRFDQRRSEVLGRYDQALREWQSYRMGLEKHAGGQRYLTGREQVAPLANEVGQYGARPQAAP
jgi:hypothetical protein